MGMDMKKCGYKEAARTWMAVVFAAQTPGGSATTDSVVPAERIAHVDVAHHVLVVTARSLPWMARVCQLVAESLPEDFRVLI